MAEYEIYSDQETEPGTEPEITNVCTNFRKGEMDAHHHLNDAFLYVLDQIAGAASGSLADRARELALEARETALSAKELAEYTLALVREKHSEYYILNQLQKIYVHYYC